MTELPAIRPQPVRTPERGPRCGAPREPVRLRAPSGSAASRAETAQTSQTSQWAARGSVRKARNTKGSREVRDPATERAESSSGQPIHPTQPNLPNQPNQSDPPNHCLGNRRAHWPAPAHASDDASTADRPAPLVAGALCCGKVVIGPSSLPDVIVRRLRRRWSCPWQASRRERPWPP